MYSRFAYSWARCLCVSLVWLAASLQSHPLAAAQTTEVRRILILYEAGIQWPAMALINDALGESLQGTKYHIEIYREYMETEFLPDEADQKQLRDFYIRKYQHHRPDVIITVGSSPLGFIAKERDKHFAGIPVIFCHGYGLDDDFKHEPGFTGVTMGIEAATTLNAALHLVPGTKHVFVIGGRYSPSDRQMLQKVKQQLEDYSTRLDVTYISDLGFPQGLKRLSMLPSASIVLHVPFGRDANGVNYTSRESGPLIISAANVPVFSLFDVYIGHGEVGGYLSELRAQGTIAGSAALKVLDGVSPSDIPVATAPNSFVFDSRALKRWGLKESDLPPGSIVLYRQPTAWESYKWYIISGISLILVEALLILALLWQRARRRKVEAELVTTYERLRLAVTAGKSVGWDWDIGSGRDRWFGDLQTMFGIRSHTYSGHIEEFRGRKVHPEDRKLVWKAVANAVREHKQYISEFRVVHPDGTVRWITANGSFYYTVDGRAKRMLGIAVDITERKRSEERLRESEERFRLVANTAPVLIWMAGPDKLCNYFNQRWLEFTGRSIEAELGNGWTERVHPEDLKICLDTYTVRFDLREPFEMQYRLRRKDGEYRWISDFGVPRFDPDGSFAGYIGSCVDVTERKMVEEAWAGLSGRLIDAQEEERKRIAREIHDDYSQQLAVAAVDLEALAEDVGDFPVGTGQRFHKIWNQISELGSDLHSLSHRLHSSTLESLGLVAGVKAFCEEFAAQKEVQVDFTHGNVPRGIPAEVALCLFSDHARRASKHQTARVVPKEAEVHLEVSGEDLHLSVVDRGKGFDVKKLSTRKGIGIRSMEERLRSLGGHLEIKSRPTEGTRIEAWLPSRVPDGFINDGSGVLKQLEKHVTPRFQQELVDPTEMYRRVDLPEPPES